MQDRTLTAEVTPGDEITVAGWVHEIRDLGGIAFLILRDRSGKIQIKFEKDEMNDEIVQTGLDVPRESVISITGVADDEPRAPTDVEIVPTAIEVLINTPKIVATGTEGGTELFPITYFGEEAFMNQSPQLFKQLMIGSGLERVFEIGPIFRAEEHNTPRHLNEATSIDFESAFINHAEAMDACEYVVTAAYQGVAENCITELETLGLRDGFSVPDESFPRISYQEAIERINATGELDEQLVWGDDLPTDGERALGADVGSHYFITDWPSEIKPFYIKDHDDDKTLSTGFDMMHPQMELVSGGQREHRYEHLVSGFEQQGLDPEQFDYYTKMFRYGMPPHAGWGLGGERLVMTMLGLENIREAVLFPRDRQRLSP